MTQNQDTIDNAVAEENLQLAELEMIRAEERAASDAAAASEAATGPSVKKMGWLVFLAALAITLIQAVVIYFTAGTIGWLIGIFLSGILLAITWPYRESMKEARWFLNASLVVDALPILDFIPLDTVAIIYVFIKSRSHTVQRIVETVKHNPVVQQAITVTQTISSVTQVNPETKLISPNPK